MSAFEKHGVWAANGDKGVWVDISEVDGGISLEVPYASHATLTAPQAHYIARKLHRLARRLEGDRA